MVGGEMFFLEAVKNLARVAGGYGTGSGFCYLLFCFQLHEV